MNLLTAVRISKRALKKNTNALVIPCSDVNLSTTKLVTVTEIANTVRNPVFMPKIKKRAAATSPGLLADKLERLTFSEEANLGTLKIAFIRNKINMVIDTVLT